MGIDTDNFQFAEQTQLFFPIISRGRNYTHRSGALRLYTYICKGASKRRMLLCSLLDKLFLKNPPAKARLFFSLEAGTNVPHIE